MRKKHHIINIIAAQHPGEEVLEEYRRHRLPLSVTLEVEEHLLLCSSCQDEVDELEVFAEKLRLAYGGSKALPRFCTA